jgi:AICAR transformylase/IMP cyclohydrolase PurH
MRVKETDLSKLVKKKSLRFEVTKKIYTNSQKCNETNFSDEITIRIGEKELILPKITWVSDNENISMRYGTNPSQTASMYGNKSNWKFVKMGKNGPSTTNIQDINQGLEIIKFFDDDRPASVVMKHLIPSGFSIGNNGESQAGIYERSRDLDFLSSFGGVVVLNQPLEYKTAEKIAETFIELVAAPKIDEEIISYFRSNPKKKNLRLIEFGDISNVPKYLEDYKKGIEDYFSLITLNDGSLILERPYLSPIKTIDDFSD